MYLNKYCSLLELNVSFIKKTIHLVFIQSYSYMMSIVILSAPGFIYSPLTLVNKTATTITVSLTPVPFDANGYVVNATSNTHTLKQQVKGGSQNEITWKGTNTISKL